MTTYNLIWRSFFLQGESVFDYLASALIGINSASHLMFFSNFFPSLFNIIHVSVSFHNGSLPKQPFKKNVYILGTENAPGSPWTGTVLVNENKCNLKTQWPQAFSFLLLYVRNLAAYRYISSKQTLI